MPSKKPSGIFGKSIRGQTHQMWGARTHPDRKNSEASKELIARLKKRFGREPTREEIIEAVSK